MAGVNVRIAIPKNVSIDARVNDNSGNVKNYQSQNGTQNNRSQTSSQIETVDLDETLDPSPSTNTDLPSNQDTQKTQINEQKDVTLNEGESSQTQQETMNSTVNQEPSTQGEASKNTGSQEELSSKDQIDANPSFETNKNKQTTQGSSTSGMSNNSMNSNTTSNIGNSSPSTSTSGQGGVTMGSSSSQEGNDTAVKVDGISMTSNSNGDKMQVGINVSTETTQSGKIADQTEIDIEEYQNQLRKLGIREGDIQKILDGKITIEGLMEEIESDENRSRYEEILIASYLQSAGLDCTTLEDVEGLIEKNQQEIEKLQEEKTNYEKGNQERKVLQTIVSDLQLGMSLEDALEYEIVGYRYKDKDGNEKYEYGDLYSNGDFDRIEYEGLSYKELFGDEEIKKLEQLLTVEDGKHIWDGSEEQQDYIRLLYEESYNDNSSSRVEEIEEKVATLNTQNAQYEAYKNGIKNEVDYYMNYIDPYVRNEDFEKYSSAKETDTILEKIFDPVNYEPEYTEDGTYLYNTYHGVRYTGDFQAITISDKETLMEVLSALINGSEELINNGTSLMNKDGTIFLQADDKMLDNYEEWAPLLTEEEIAVFNYIYQTEGYEAAYNHLEELTNEMDNRWLSVQTQKDQELAAEHPILTSIASIFTTPIDGIGAACASLNALINKEDILRTDVYSAGDVWRGKISQDLITNYKHGEALSFIYNTGMSMSDSLSLIGISAVTGGIATPVLSPILMGSRAYVSTLNDALDRGLSDGEAVGLAFSSAVVESAMENYSVSHLLNLESKLGEGTIQLVNKVANKIENRTLANVATKTLYVGASTLSQAFCEGEEEFATEILNYVLDDIISGDLSNRNIQIQEAIANGYTLEEAENMANMNFIDQLKQAFLGGFVSGVCFGIFGGVKSTYNISKGISLGIQEKYQVSKENVNSVLEELGTSKAQAFANQIQASQQIEQEVEDPTGKQEKIKGFINSIFGKITSVQTSIEESVESQTGNIDSPYYNIKDTEWGKSHPAITELMEEWDNAQIQIPKELGASLEAIINDPTKVLGIHRTALDSTDIFSSPMMQSIFTEGLINNAGAQQGGVLNHAPSPSQTISMVSTPLLLSIYLKSSYKSPGTFMTSTGGVILSLPSEFIDADGGIVEGKESEIYDVHNGMYYVKPEYILGYVSQENNICKFYSKEEVLNAQKGNDIQSKVSEQEELTDATKDSKKLEDLYIERYSNKNAYNPLMIFEPLFKWGQENHISNFDSWSFEKQAYIDIYEQNIDVGKENIEQFLIRSVGTATGYVDFKILFDYVNQNIQKYNLSAKHLQEKISFFNNYLIVDNQFYPLALNFNSNKNSIVENPREILTLENVITFEEIEKSNTIVDSIKEESRRIKEDAITKILDSKMNLTASEFNHLLRLSTSLEEGKLTTYIEQFLSHYQGSLKEIQYHPLLPQSVKEQIMKIVTEEKMSYFDSFNDDHSNYFGADQNAGAKFLALGLFNTQEFTRLKNKLMEQGMSAKEAVKTLKNIDSTGVCSYAAIVNMLFMKYQNNPSGFKNDFGFDMYTTISGKTRLNTSELIIDLYIYANSNLVEESANLFNIEDGKISLNKMKTKEQVYLSHYAAINTKIINQYLQSKNENLNIIEKTSAYSFDTKEQVQKFVIQALQQGKEIDLGFYSKKWYNELINPSFKLYSENHSVLTSTSTRFWNSMGHAVYVVGLNEEGIIVSSWGQKLIIPYNDFIKDNTFSMKAVEINGISNPSSNQEQVSVQTEIQEDTTNLNMQINEQVNPSQEIQDSVRAAQFIELKEKILGLKSVPAELVIPLKNFGNAVKQQNGKYKIYPIESNFYIDSLVNYCLDNHLTLEENQQTIEQTIKKMNQSIYDDIMQEGMENYYGTPTFLQERMEAIMDGLADMFQSDFFSPDEHSEIQNAYLNASQTVASVQSLFELDTLTYDSYEQLEQAYLTLEAIENQLTKLNEKRWQQFFEEKNAKFVHVLSGKIVPVAAMDKICTTLVTDNVMPIANYGHVGYEFGVNMDNILSLCPEDSGSWSVGDKDSLTRKFISPEEGIMDGWQNAGSGYWFETGSYSQLYSPEYVEQYSIDANLKANGEILNYKQYVAYSEIFLLNKEHTLKATKAFYTDDATQEEIAEIKRVAAEQGLEVEKLSLDEARIRNNLPPLNFESTLNQYADLLDSDPRLAVIMNQIEQGKPYQVPADLSQSFNKLMELYGKIQDYASLANLVQQEQMNENASLNEEIDDELELAFFGLLNSKKEKTNDYNGKVESNANGVQYVNAINQQISQYGGCSVTVNSTADISSAMLSQISDLSKLQIQVLDGLGDGNYQLKEKYNRETYEKRTTYTGLEMQQIMKEIEYLESRIDKSLPTYDKAKQLYELIASRFSYMKDFRNYEDGHLIAASLRGITDYNATGKKGLVCAGFASLYSEVCKRLGIYCEYVRGDANDNRGHSEKHAWNVLKIDGQVIPVDVTWKACNFSSDWFGPSEQFQKQHVADKDETYKRYNIPLPFKSAVSSSLTAGEISTILSSIETTNAVHGHNYGIQALKYYLQTGEASGFTRVGNARYNIQQIDASSIRNYFETMKQDVQKAIDTHNQKYPGKGISNFKALLQDGNYNHFTSTDGARDMVRKYSTTELSILDKIYHVTDVEVQTNNNFQGLSETELKTINRAVLLMDAAYGNDAGIKALKGYMQTGSDTEWTRNGGVRESMKGIPALPLRTYMEQMSRDMSKVIQIHDQKYPGKGMSSFRGLLEDGNYNHFTSTNGARSIAQKYSIGELKLLQKLWEYLSREGIYGN